MEHRCPGCGGVRAERRTPRNYRERAALAVLGYHPYRCLDCERRFLDRPLSRAAGEEAPAAPPPPPAIPEHAATLVITTDGGGETHQRRRPRWVVDAGNSPLGSTEIYALVLAAAVLILVTLAVLRFVWPESAGGVRLAE